MRGVQAACQHDVQLQGLWAVHGVAPCRTCLVLYIYTVLDNWNFAARCRGKRVVLAFLCIMFPLVAVCFPAQVLTALCIYLHLIHRGIQELTLTCTGDDDCGLGPGGPGAVLRGQRRPAHQGPGLQRGLRQPVRVRRAGQRLQVVRLPAATVLKGLSIGRTPGQPLASGGLTWPEAVRPSCPAVLTTHGAAVSMCSSSL